MMLKILNNLNNALFLQSTNLLQGLVFFSFLYSLFNIAVLQQWWLLSLVPIALVMNEFIISAYYHRFITHKSWECPRWLEYILISICTSFGFGAVIGWAGTHRNHHHKSDVPGEDPHGPTRTWWENITVFSKPPAIRYCKSMFKDKLLFGQAQYYWPLWALGATLWSLAIGPEAYFFFVFNFFFWQIWVNIVGHTDNPLNGTGWLGSEGYHKFHHEYPNSARFGRFDISYLLMIRWFPHTNHYKKNVA